MPTKEFTVETSQGPGQLFVDAADEPTAILVLGHGARGGTNAVDLELLARSLPESGITVARFEQPWRSAGARVAPPPSKLDDAWLGATHWLLRQSWATDLLFVGGRSAGARVACRTAHVLQPVGIICLAFPLHLPGQPEKSRIAELLAPKAPRLVIQGSSDAFGRPAEILAAIGDATGIRLIELPGADHSFRVAKSSEFTPADLRAVVLSGVNGFVASQLGIRSP